MLGWKVVVELGYRGEASRTNEDADESEKPLCLRTLVSSRG